MNQTDYSTVATSSRDSMRFAAAVGAAALLLGAAFAGTAPRLAFADSSTAIPTFRWNLQLDNGVSMAGISTDLPDAIRLAELGETLTPAQMAQITQVLTTEAQEENASLTSVAPVVPASTPTAVAPSGDDSGNGD